VEKLILVNGNKQYYQIDLPKLVIRKKDEINETALAHMKDNTGLEFVPCWCGYEAQPTTSNQIAALFLTWNFETQYYNNADFKNTLFLKLDSHVGFSVDSICYACVEHNNIHTKIEPGERLAC
jgi:hypothetical protein